MKNLQVILSGQFMYIARIYILLVLFTSCDGLTLRFKDRESIDWTQRLTQFQRDSTFELGKVSSQLLGVQRVAHLPYWFDHQLFKVIYQKDYADQQEELKRHHEYIKTCMRVLKSRVSSKYTSREAQSAYISVDADSLWEASAGWLKDTIEFDIGRLSRISISDLKDENPIDKAIRLLKSELDSLDDKDHLDRYMRELDATDFVVGQSDYDSIFFEPLAQIQESKSFKRVCYFSMDPRTEMQLSQVDGNLCSHVIMAYATIDSNSELILGNENAISYLREVSEFKRKYPLIKVMISICNDLVYDGFPKVAVSADGRGNLSRSVIEFLQVYNLDGVDLDWEFPNFPTTLISREHERKGLTEIMRSLRAAINRDFLESQQRCHNDHEAQRSEPYLLTVAVAAPEAVLEAGYEVKEVAELSDWLNIMSYDYYLFHSYTPFTGPNSPLYSICSPLVPVLGKLSFDWTLNRLLEYRVPKSKIVMGIPTYARAYRLLFHNSNPTAFTTSTGHQGGKRLDDYMDYREVCEILKKPDTVSVFDETARVPYLLTDSGYLWISYENERSVREKVRHVMNNQLAGYMTWNLNSDDFIGVASSATNESDTTKSLISFPLHKAMLAEVSSSSQENDSQSASSKPQLDDEIG